MWFLRLKRAAKAGMCCFGAVLVLFLVHRIGAFAFLLREDDPGWLRLIASFTIGALSDYWIAALLGTAAFLIGLLISKLWLLAVMNAVLVIVLGGMLSLHQAYIEFFGIQILPFHLRYLTDTSFLTAQGITWPSTVQWILIAATLGVGLYCGSSVLIQSHSVRWRPALSLFLILLTSVLAHVVNIRYRVNLFIEPDLQLNVIERLAIQLARTADAPELSQTMVAAMGGQKADQKQLLSDYLFTSTSPGISRLGMAIKDQLQLIKARGRQPQVIVVLLESARPSDFSIYAQHAGLKVNVDLTPEFDRLAQSGVLFTNAYSTGTVTRSGQEAVWCGTYSNMYSSMMRERSDFAWPCLPQRLRSQVKSLWLHGGEGNFDNQRTFWLKQGVDTVVTQQDFPTEVERLGWGVGDDELFKLSADKLSHEHERPVISQLLTVSNHIPWALPKLASLEVNRELLRAHPSVYTVRYVDQALGSFVKALRDNGVWERSVVIFVGDHGAKIPPYYDLYGSDEFLRQRLMSHVVLLVSGGITAKALSSQSPKSTGQVIQHAVSQAGVASFVGWLFNDDGSYFAEQIFAEEGGRPVFTSLEKGYFFPQSSHWYEASKLAKLNYDSLSAAQKKDFLFLVSFVQFMQRPSNTVFPTLQVEPHEVRE